MFQLYEIMRNSGRPDVNWSVSSDRVYVAYTETVDFLEDKGMFNFFTPHTNLTIGFCDMDRLFISNATGSGRWHRWNLLRNGAEHLQVKVSWRNPVGPLYVASVQRLVLEITLGRCGRKTERLIHP